MVQMDMIEEIVHLLRSASERELMIALAFIRSLIYGQSQSGED